MNATDESDVTPEAALEQLATAFDAHQQEIDTLTAALDAARNLAADQTARRAAAEVRADKAIAALDAWKSSKSFRYTQKLRSAYGKVSR